MTCDDVVDFGEVPILIMQKLRVILALIHPGVDREPCWKSPMFPFGTEIEADTDDSVHPHFLDQTQLGIEIDVVRRLTADADRFGGPPVRGY